MSSSGVHDMGVALYRRADTARLCIGPGSPCGGDEHGRSRRAIAHHRNSVGDDAAVRCSGSDSAPTMLRWQRLNTTVMVSNAFRSAGLAPCLVCAEPVRAASLCCESHGHRMCADCVNGYVGS